MPLSPLPPTATPLSVQLPHPRFEAGSVAGTPRTPHVAPADSYGWASDAPLDGDSADGMSPRSGAGDEAAPNGIAALALQATGGEPR